MAIDLPPVLPPQLATQSQIEASAFLDQSRVQQATIAGVTLRVIGNTALSAAQVQALLDAATSPSAAITELTRQYYNAGHLLVGVRYFRVGDTVTVLVKQNTLSGVRGEKGIAAHFQGLVGDADLQMAEFDRARVLADWRADRAGLDYAVSFEQHDDDKVIMELVSRPAADYQATEFQMSLDNRGSRFLGRYFAEANVVQRLPDGSEFSGSYQTALTDLGESNQGDDYHQADLRYQRATRFGLYGISGSYLSYSRELGVTQAAESNLLCELLGIACTSATTNIFDLDAEVGRVALQGEQVLRSNPARRITVFQQLEYVDSSIETEAGERLLEERYATLGLGTRYAWRGQHFGQRASLRAELGVNVGLSDNEGSLGTDTSDGVGIGRRQADFVTLAPQLAYKLEWPQQWRSTALFTGQFANDVQLPQQQQWVLGGMNGLSAWLPGALLGDSGYLLNIAMQRDWYWGTLQFTTAAFAEWGAAWFEDARPDLSDSQNASDAGLRLGVVSDWGLSSELIAAAPLADDVSDAERLENLRADFYWRLKLRF
ncbi:hypothetical protein IB286_00505 [Spongiibacter sp. KMU-158]|uniref:Hemolysin activation/secretion protein n=1 Tax=Spongiibacter pelagi TaxID=2760804 RepID=A0A927C0C6_9GAMM|nr:hypothetical protein [Spongiibacter pelagi]MBD2857466.1 hypothetical protein [Spongiibacter pelagi]